MVPHVHRRRTWGTKKQKKDNTAAGEIYGVMNDCVRPNIIMFYPIHPFTIHFPIALLLVNGLLTLLYLRYAEHSLETSAYHCLIIGWCGACVAVVTGLIDAWRQLGGPETAVAPALINRVNAHAVTSILVVVVYGRALLQRRRQPDILDDARRRRGYLGLLLVGALLLLITSWLGGYLIYVLGLDPNR